MGISQTIEEGAVMANRFQTNQHELAYNFIAARDGEYCLDPSCRKRPPAVKLQIDHADNDINNWEPDNLHLLCQRHNLAMRALTRTVKVNLIKKYSAENECVRAREFGNTSTHAVREMVDYRQGSTEMQANSFYETQYRTWILDYLKQNQTHLIPRDDAIYAGAEMVGCSPTTSERYLKKLCSSAGPLMKHKDGTGTVVIVFREGKGQGRE
jgi:hypothetical protein